MASADTENAGGVHATGSAPGADSGALEQRIDELMKDAEKTLVAFEQGDPPGGPEIVSGDVPGPAIEEPFDIAKLSAELEGALRQAEDVARKEREAEKEVLDITPDSMVAVAVSATAEANAVGPDGEPLLLIDLEALDNALAQAADAVGFGIGGVEEEPPRTERVEQLAHQIEIPSDPVVERAPAQEPVMNPMAQRAAAAVVAEQGPTEPVVPVAAETVGVDADIVAQATEQPVVEVVQEAPAPVEPVAMSAAIEPAPMPEPVALAKVSAPAPPEPRDPGKNPAVGLIEGVLRLIASPLTVMSPAVRDLVGWLGLLTAFNAVCVWVFVMVVGPGNWPLASAHGASTPAHEERSSEGHGAAKPSEKDGHGASTSGHGAPAKKDAGHSAPAKKESGHGGAAKKPASHGAPKEQKKAGGGHGGH